MKKWVSRLLGLVASCFVAASVRAEEWVLPIPDWDRPPYTYRTASGNYTGFDIELLTELGRRIGVEFVLAPLPLEARRQGFAKGEFVIECCLNPAWRTRPEEVSAQLFSEPIYTGLDVFIFPKGKAFAISEDFHELGTKTVAGIKGYAYTGEEAFGRRLDVSDQKQLLEALASGKADVGILERHVAAHYSRVTNIKIDFGPVQHHADVGIRLHKKKAAFLPRINEAIAAMRADGFVRRAMRKQGR